MNIVLVEDRQSMGTWVASHAAEDLRRTIASSGRAHLLVATGASQFEVLNALVAQPGIDWSKVHAFHLDEYVGLSDQHPASFCRFLRERFVEKVPLASFLFLNGERDAKATVSDASSQLSSLVIDVALVGVGENGHLAFNDPPANFATHDPYLIVELDHACRMQQVGEGWFASIEDVPTHAISMSVRQIMKSRKIYCSVPDKRKATAVAGLLSGDVRPELPASILREHHSTYLVIDKAAASQLDPQTLATVEHIA